MEGVGIWIAAVSAIVGGVFSWMNYRVSKRKVYAEVLPQSRLSWIKDVRVALIDFLDAYQRESILEPCERSQLMLAKTKIELYLNYTYRNTGDSNIGYIELKNVLNNYLNSKSAIVEHDDLVVISQRVFDDVMKRVKDEVGITNNMDATKRRQFNK
jgi:hypothetical protein